MSSSGFDAKTSTIPFGVSLAIRLINECDMTASPSHDGAIMRILVDALAVSCIPSGT